MQDRQWTASEANGRPAATTKGNHQQSRIAFTEIQKHQYIHFISVMSGESPETTWKLPDGIEDHLTTGKCSPLYFYLFLPPWYLNVTCTYRFAQVWSSPWLELPLVDWQVWFYFDLVVATELQVPQWDWALHGALPTNELLPPNKEKITSSHTYNHQ